MSNPQPRMDLGSALAELRRVECERDIALDEQDRLRTLLSEQRPPQLNGPMVLRLRKCAADTSPNWDGKITIYPPEARQLIDLIDRSHRDIDHDRSVS